MANAMTALSVLRRVARGETERITTVMMAVAVVLLDHEERLRRLEERG